MEKNLPKISIIIPVYNGANYIKEAIDSAIAQTYKNIEIIVVNDGSTDDSEKIIKSYGNKILYYKKENGGVSTALNLGISKMTGEYFSWLSHDDRYYPNKIEVQVNYLIENNLLNKSVITYTNYDVIDEYSNIINEVNFNVFGPNKKPEYALLRGLISGTALLIPKQAFMEYGVFDTKYRCIQDYLLFFKFMKTYKYIFIEEITNSTRIHSKQVTHINSNVIEENNFLWTYMQENLPDNIKIELEGSLYNFYSEMYKFLVHHNNYTEAHKYSLNQAHKYLQIEQEKLKQIINELSEKELFLQVKKYYKSIYESLRNTKLLQTPLYSVINNIGIENTIHFILSNSKLSDNKIKSKYNKIIFTYTHNYHNCLYRLNKSIKTDGLYLTNRKFYIKVKNRLLSYKIFRLILKLIKLFNKIVLFIPKKIILFILNS